MKRDYKKIYKNIRLDGFFSEYLPPCFKLDEKMFKNPSPANCDLIQPYSFTMSRFNSNDSRRTIFIPEIGAYSALNEYIENNQILEELTDFIDDNSLSFSKVIMEDSSIRKHEQVYGRGTIKGEKINSQYMDNVVKKIIMSAGAKKVLKLDIANCFSSFYTHYIPAIIMGYEEAEESYKKAQQLGTMDNNYKKYSNLDTIIRRQNKNQTNGLLVGPIISKIIVEGLLTRIDIELKNQGVSFSRYVDDYEVYLFEADEERIKSLFVSVLKKYGLNLNFEKTEVVDFPYYVVRNFDRLIEIYRDNKANDYDLIKLFNDFFEIEKSGTKGAIRYLLKSLMNNSIDFKNKELFDSYILTIMSNDSRSLTKACSLLIDNSLTSKLNEQHVNKLKRMTVININKEYDLEVIWLLYLLIETNNITLDDEIVKSIIESNNELVQLMVLRKNLTSNIEKISQNAKSWILNYELFADDFINIDELCNRLSIDHNKGMYQKLKERRLHFCYQ